jgi:hypothetical protein
MTPKGRQIVREELMRSIVWFGIGLVGWPLVVSNVEWLDATVLTVAGLPALTWASLTAGAIAVRVSTGATLRARTSTRLPVAVLLGVALGGVAAVYLVAAADRSPLWVTAGYVAVTAATVAWYWVVNADAVPPYTAT